jgi:hypothetical protein
MLKKRRTAPSFLAATLVAMLSHTAVADDAGQFIEDALKFGQTDGKYGEVKVDLNYRYENVDQDHGSANPNLDPRTANANTLRLRLGYLTPAFHGLQGFAEYEGNYALQTDYNNGPDLNNKPEFSTVADPGRNELNQLWISYAGIPDTLIKGGRQRIKFDDDRFIGNVGWRQLETTFDAVLLTNKSIAGLIVNAGFIGNVQTFQSTTENIDAPILNINYKVGDYGNLIGYGYWLDYRESEFIEKSSQTYGIRFNGATPKFYDHYNMVYTAEWGYQSDYGHGRTGYEVDRFNLMGGFTAYNVTFQGAMEQLNGVGANKTFDTPLGTNHAFQGWADLFLNTPANGIRDVFGTINVALDEYQTNIIGVYHDFTDDTGQQQYGKEWDFMVVKKFGKHYTLLAKYANYNADSGLATPNNTDTQKIWMQGNINF